jgi:two-component system, cell cycle sensor histidine kinase and response regulator CckA
VDVREATDRGVAAGRYATLSVTDTGVGMDEETQARLFEPFFTTKVPGKGTGLGLPTVYGVVQQSGGFVLVDTRLGAGSTFRVCLPNVNEPAEDPEGGSNRFETTTGTETVLVVEDEESVRQLVAAILERLGYAVLTARDGAEALETWRGQADRIDLVITDVVMPRLDGPAFVHAIRLTHPGTRVIYLSGYTEDAVTRHRMAVGDETPLLQKPFTSGALARMVRSVLDRQPS